MSFEIRKCTADDLCAVAEMYDNLICYMDTTGTNYPMWTYKEYPSCGSIKQAIAANTQYAAFCDGILCGAFVLNDDPQGAYDKAKWSIELSQGEYAVIHSLGVVQTMYGRGIASMMIDFCKETAKNAGYRALRVDVVPTNTPARRLYEKNGFVFIEERDLERGIPTIPLFDLYEFVL